MTAKTTQLAVSVEHAQRTRPVRAYRTLAHLPASQMHSYTHHIGDWASHTQHLSWMERAAYHVLIEAYYLRESALPNDLHQVFRIVRAMTRLERDAVRSVLHEFFVLNETDNSWHQKRCDAEIDRYRKFSNKQRANVEKRWGVPAVIKKALKESKALQTSKNRIVDRPGMVFLPNTPGTNGDSSGHPQEYQTDSVVIQPVIPNHKPVTINTPNTHNFNAENIAADAASVCVDKGLKVGKTDSLLLALIHRGAGIADFAEAASLAVAAGKGFAYAAGIVNNRLSDANGIREGTKTGSGSTNDPRSVWYVPSEKKSL